MKNLKLTWRSILVALICPISSFAQVINGGFESWDSIPFLNNGMNFLPTGWFETNNEFCYRENTEWSITRTTDAYKGNYAIQLKNVASSIPQNAMLLTSNPYSADFNNKIPITGKPSRLEFYYKFTSPVNDTFIISVFTTKNDEFVGIGYAQKTLQNNEYTKLSIPIFYQPGTSIMPDSALIIFEIGNYGSFVEGSTLIIDEVAFGYSTGIVEKQTTFNADVEIWPNPVTDMVNVNITGAQKKVTVELVNMFGQTLQQTNLEAKGKAISTSFNLKEFNSGVYFIKVSDSTGAKGFRILR